jgi:hypothetical protein
MSSETGVWRATSPWAMLCVLIPGLMITHLQHVSPWCCLCFACHSPNKTCSSLRPDSIVPPFQRSCSRQKGPAEHSEWKGLSTSGNSDLFCLRASPLVSPTRPPASLFFIRTAKNGPVAPPDPRFRPDLGLHPSGELRPTPAFRGALGDSGRNKLRETAENIRARSRGSCGPDLSARVGGRRRRHRLIFRASSSPHASSSARCKGCRRWPASHAARRVNATAAI